MTPISWIHLGRRRLRWALLAAPLLVAVAACSSTPSAVGKAGPEVPAAPAAEYIIGPGDTLRVFVLRNAELTAEVPVRPDGKISTPLVNDMVAVGKTASQLGHDIEQVLAEYVRNPSVSIIVVRPAGALGQVRVVGQAMSPRAIPYRSGITVLDVIIEVGGLSQYAAGNRAKVIRVDNGVSREIHVKLDNLLNKGDVTQNIAMQAGDILFIPEARF